MLSAGRENRTPNCLITNQIFYLLKYSSKNEERLIRNLNQSVNIEQTSLMHDYLTYTSIGRQNLHLLSGGNAKHHLRSFLYLLLINIIIIISFVNPYF